VACVASDACCTPHPQRRTRTINNFPTIDQGRADSHDSEEGSRRAPRRPPAPRPSRYPDEGAIASPRSHCRRFDRQILTRLAPTRRREEIDGKKGEAKEERRLIVGGRVQRPDVIGYHCISRAGPTMLDNTRPCIPDDSSARDKTMRGKRGGGQKVRRGRRMREDCCRGNEESRRAFARTPGRCISRLIGLPSLLVRAAYVSIRRSSIVRRSARKHCATRPGVRGGRGGWEEGRVITRRLVRRLGDTITAAGSSLIGLPLTTTKTAAAATTAAGSLLACVEK